MAGKIIIVVWLVVLALAPFPLAYAQQPKKVPRIGVISPAFPSAAAPFIEAFREGLHDLSYIEGKSVVVEARYGEGKEDRLPALAAELVHVRVDIIVAGEEMRLWLPKTQQRLFLSSWRQQVILLGVGLLPV